MRAIRNWQGTWALLGADGLILAIGNWSEVSKEMESWK